MRDLREKDRGREVEGGGGEGERGRGRGGCVCVRVIGTHLSSGSSEERMIQLHEIKEVANSPSPPQGSRERERERKGRWGEMRERRRESGEIDQEIHRFSFFRKPYAVCG